MVTHSVVYFHPTVTIYLDELGKRLFDAGYFGFRESALLYVKTMVAHIRTNIHILSAKPAPDFFTKYGTDLCYIIYRPNRQTTWYIFFQQQGNRYLVRYITNNHFEGQYIR